MFDMTQLNLTLSAPNRNSGLIFIRNGQQQLIDNQRTTGFAAVGDKFYRVIQHENFCEIQVSQELSGKSVIFKQFKDVHDIYSYGNKIYLASTGTNEIAVLDGDLNLIKCYRYHGVGDAWHINCLVGIDGDVYFGAFCNYEEDYTYKGKTKNSGFIMNAVTGEVVVDGLSQPHSPRYVDGLLYLCDSEKSRVLIFDNFILSKEIKLKGYVRGLCVDEAFIYAGVSKSRNIDDNAVDSARLIIIDKFDLRTLAEISLPVDEVYQISHGLSLSCITSLGCLYDDWDLSQKCDDLNRAIEVNKRTAEQAENELLLMNGKLDKAEQELGQISRVLEMRDQELAQVKQDSKSLEHERDQAKRQVEASRQELDHIRQVLQARDQELAKAKQDSQSLEYERDQVEQQLVINKQEVDQAKSNLQRYNEELVNLKQDVAYKDNSLRQAEKKLNEQRESLKALENEIITVNSELEKSHIELTSLYLSRSWRVTRPFRKVVRRFAR